MTRRRLLTGAGIAGAAVGGGAWLYRPPPVSSSPGWGERASMATARGEMKAAVVDGEAYVPGGLSGTGEGMAMVAKYDPAADEWTSLSSLPEPRNHHATVAVDGQVLVLGGSTAFHDPPSATVFAYDPRTDEWTRRPPMPDGRWGHDAVVHDGTVYVVGGVSSNGSAAVLAYDPDAGEWERRAPMPTPREHLAAVVVDDAVYAVSGRWNDENRTIVSTYDPAADQWRSIDPVPTPRSGTAGAVLDGRVHVAGGEDPSAVGGWVTDAHETYDPTVGEWTEAPPLPLRLHGPAAVVLDDALHVFGGAWRQGPWSITAWSDRTFVYEP